MSTRCCTWPNSDQARNDPDRNSADADQQPGQPLGRDVEQRDEDAEEQQRRAEVALEDQDAEAGDPGDEDRPEVAGARQVDADDAAAGQRQHVALGHQVAGEEDDQQDLGELAGLEREAGEPDPDPRAVDGGADQRQQRQQQQHEAGEHGGVGEALQDAVVAHQDQHDDEQDDADGGPGQLGRRGRGRDVVAELLGAVGVGQVEPVDDGEPEAVDHGHGGQQHRVGVRGEPAQRQVGAAEEERQPAAVPEHAGGQRRRRGRGRPRRTRPSRSPARRPAGPARSSRLLRTRAVERALTSPSPQSVVDLGCRSRWWLGVGVGARASGSALGLAGAAGLGLADGRRRRARGRRRGGVAAVLGLLAQAGDDPLARRPGRRWRCRPRTCVALVGGQVGQRDVLRRGRASRCSAGRRPGTAPGRSRRSSPRRRRSTASATSGRRRVARRPRGRAAGHQQRSRAAARPPEWCVVEVVVLLRLVGRRTQRGGLAGRGVGRACVGRRPRRRRRP